MVLYAAEGSLQGMWLAESISIPSANRRPGVAFGVLPILPDPLFETRPYYCLPR